MFRATLLWLRWWAILVILYLLLVETSALPEIVAALLAAAAAGAAAALAAHVGGVHLSARLGWFVVLLRRVPGHILADCGLLARALWDTVVLRRAPQGAFHVVPFNAGGADPRAAARRAVVLLGVSLPPNSYVVDINVEGDYLLIHRLVARPTPPGGGDREWPL